MSPLVKGLLILFGFPVVLTVVFFTYFHVTGEERMKAVCAEIKPGMTRSEVTSFTLEKNLHPSDAGEGGVVLGNSLSYGRHGCRLSLAAGVVTTAGYIFVDN